MIAGTLEIQLMANMARLASDMDKAKRTVTGTVESMNKILGTIGVGISFAGFANLIKTTADAADKMRDLKIISGLTIEQLGGLGKAAAMNGSNIDQVARAIGVMSKNMYSGVDAFKTLSIQTRAADGSLRDAGQVLLDVADKFSRMEDGATKSALANQIFGKSGRDLIPTLNQGRGELEQLISSYAKHSGMTQKLADDSDKFNDILFLLGERATGVKNTFVGELLPTLINIGNAMLQSTENTNKFSFAAQVVVPVLKGLALAGYTVVDTFRGVGREIGARAAQLVALANFDFKGAQFIGDALAEDNAKARAEFDKFFDTILNGQPVVQESVREQQKMLNLQTQLPAPVNAATKAIEKQAKAFDIEVYKLKTYQDEAARARQITDSVATKQERYNKTLEELERLKPYLTIETYNRALEKAQGELDKTAIQTRTATDEVSQMWIQAGRNIQSALGNLVFDFFSGGLDNMVKNAGNAVLRIMSEFAGLRIAQGLGLASLFTAGTAAASTGAAAGGGMSLLSGASLAANGLSLFKSGFGATSLLSGVGGMLPGSAGAFFSGIGGGAIPGVSSSAALAGGSFGAMLGPVAALAGVDMIGRMLAGDKKLGGAEMIPVVGGFLAAMFGRGPYKFRQQSLQGTVSSGGFDGDITNVFRSKGGLFMKNKHQPRKEQLTPEMQMLFDSTIGGFFQAASASAANLGLDAKLVENFSKEIQIKSEKGQKLTEEAITQMLQGIGDDIAKAAMPVVDEFKKIGETSIQTLSRLSNEFTVLTGAAGLLFNKSAEWSKGFVSSFGFGDRNAFLDKAGGADAFAAMVAGFAGNFLTEDQRMRPVIESLVSQRDALGLSNINTRQKVTDAVQSGRLNPDQLLFLLKNQEAINQVFVYLDKFNTSVDKTAESLANATRELNIRNADETEYGQRLNRSIEQTTQSIRELENIANQLNETVNDINPLSVEQARRIVSGGNLNDPNLQSALGVLRSMSGEGFGSALDFARAKALNTDAVTSLRGNIGGQIGLRNRELQMLIDEKSFFQEALARAATMYQASLPQYSDGTSYVPSTGPKLLHKGERVINASQNSDIVKTLKEIAASSAKLTDLIDRVSGGGGALLVESVA